MEELDDRRAARKPEVDETRALLITMNQKFERVDAALDSLLKAVLERNERRKKEENMSLSE